MAHFVQMKKLLQLMFFLLVFLGACPMLLAQVPCVAVTPSGAGSANGSNWSNALPGIPSSQVRGTRYYLADGSYSTTSFSQAASGTTTIEFRKAQSYDYGRASDGCSNDISAGFNASTMGAAQAKFNPVNISTAYYTFNGNGTLTASGCGGALTGSQAVAAAPPTPSDCGIKFTNNGTLPIYMSGGSSDTFNYIEVLGSGINQNQEVFGANAVTITHAYMHYSGCVYVQDVGSNTRIDHSYFWGTEVNGGSACHGQAEYEIGGMNNGVRSNNVYRDISGTAVFTFGTSGTLNNWVFYNNVIWFSSPAQTFGGIGNGVWACINNDICTNFVIVQNTIVGCNASGVFGQDYCGVLYDGGSGSFTFENNLYYSNTGANVSLIVAGGSVAITADYNSYLNSPAASASAHDVSVASGAPNPLVNWQAGNFNLASDVADWNKRVSLAAAYNTDAAGNTFTTDRGAYQFNGSSGSSPAAPTGLAAAVQ